jgi:UDP-glucose 4-epimerase
MRKLTGVLLITGGTGSFGNAVLRRFIESPVSEIRIFSRDEKKQDDMRKRYASNKLKFYLGDVRDRPSLDAALRGVNYCFHAAALKQVPSCEFHPMEAVRTNVLGTENVIAAAVSAGVKRVVCLSTDKAVYPINAMGMTKALMEKTAQAFARDFQDSETTISVTRYGNVMYSRGSVLPLFISQIKSGQPITLTDPSMTRFLMSLAESVDLVEYAFENADTGDLFVKKAPASTIEDLAKALILLFGDSSTSIKEIGFRHGEKLFESLLGSEERAKAEDLGGYFRVPLDARDLNYEVYFEEGEKREPQLDSYTSHNTERLNVSGVVELLRTIPEVREQLENAL